MVIQTEYQPRIVRGRIELWCPHGEGEIAFAPPVENSGTYADIGSEILRLKQKIPKGDETASELYVAYCGPKEIKNADEYVRIRKLMKDNWFWIFNVENWTAEGLYVIQDPAAEGMGMKLDIPTLERKLVGGPEIKTKIKDVNIRFSKDGTVRFAPKETYKFGEQSVKDFAGSGVIIANFGAEGAEKLGEVAKTFNYNPRIWGIKTKTPEQRLSAVVDYLGGRLYFVGYYHGDYRGGYASGVLD